MSLPEMIEYGDRLMSESTCGWWLHQRRGREIETLGHVREGRVAERWVQRGARS